LKSLYNLSALRHLKSLYETGP